MPWLKAIADCLGGSSLARLLYLHRGIRSPRNVPALSKRQILAWTLDHFERTGRWPSEDSGPIKDAPGETWAAIDLSLRRGRRGLPGGSSLARLLDARGIKRNPQRRPRLTHRQILMLADAFFGAHGHWPYADSGAIDGLPGETWATIDRALRRGSRGLPSGSTLISLLNKHRAVLGGRRQRPRRIDETRRLRLEQIIAWGKSHLRRKGIFPNRNSGVIVEASGLKWSAVDSALKRGNRGLLDRSSLAKLFGDRRMRKGKRVPLASLAP